MATIKIHRRNGDASFMRGWKLFIDGQEVGKINGGETKKFTVSAGQHTMRAKEWWCGSPIVKIDADDSKPNLLIVERSTAYVKWLLLSILLGFISVGIYYALDMSSKYFMFAFFLPQWLCGIYYLTIGGNKKDLTLYEISSETLRKK
ncbi:hypothetical protein FACS189467_0090 [Bacteroidia bacterium]|nr:hypothetical protein FACS189467_0090 [Bacteroidia bacterium]